MFIFIFITKDYIVPFIKKCSDSEHTTELSGFLVVSENSAHVWDNGEETLIAKDIWSTLAYNEEFREIGVFHIRP